MIEFKLGQKSGVPFYRQIIDQIRCGIATGQLKVSEQLPTVRALKVNEAQARTDRPRTGGFGRDRRF